MPCRCPCSWGYRYDDDDDGDNSNDNRRVLRWGHALNSQAELAAALASPHLNALEADVCWNPTLGLAVMKHAKESLDLNDWPAAEWLRMALTSPQADCIKVIKLDFKALAAVQPVIELLREQVKAACETEIWLNADICQGPGTLAEPVPAQEFLLAAEALPHTTLSLGWTTGWTPLATVVYRNEHVDDMLELIALARRKNPDRHVTFPIRASLVRSSWPALQRLLREVDNSSITLWTGEEGVPHVDLKVMSWADEEHVDRFHLDCDKGPKHDKYHPARFAHYIGLAVRHQRLW